MRRFVSCLSRLFLIRSIFVEDTLSDLYPVRFPLVITTGAVLASLVLDQRSLLVGLRSGFVLHVDALGQLSALSEAGVRNIRVSASLVHRSTREHDEARASKYLHFHR
jgi:hypothetical protein